MRGCVRTLRRPDPWLGAGEHTLTYGLENVPVGAYCVEIVTAGGTQARRILVAE